MKGRVDLRTEDGRVLATELGDDVPSEMFMEEVADAIDNWGVENGTPDLSIPNTGRLVIELSA